MRSLRSLLGEPLDRTNRPAVVAEAAVVRAVVARTEAEVPRGVAAARVRDGRPVEAVRTGTDERSPVAVAGAGEKDAVGSIVAPAANHVTIHAVKGRPRPVAFTP